MSWEARQGDLVFPTLLKLATLEGDGEPTRRRVARSTLSEGEGAVARRSSTLVSSDERNRRRGDVEVAHEALLRQWRPLRKAIEGSRRSLQMRSDLERLAADWHQGSRDESYLLRGERLVALRVSGAISTSTSSARSSGNSSPPAVDWRPQSLRAPAVEPAPAGLLAGLVGLRSLQAGSHSWRSSRPARPRTGAARAGPAARRRGTRT